MVEINHLKGDTSITPTDCVRQDAAPSQQPPWGAEQSMPTASRQPFCPIFEEGAQMGLIWQMPWRPQASLWLAH